LTGNPGRQTGYVLSFPGNPGRQAGRPRFSGFAYLHSHLGREERGGTTDGLFDTDPSEKAGAVCSVVQLNPHYRLVGG